MANKKTWKERLEALKSENYEEDFIAVVTAIDEHAVTVIRELGAGEMGVGPDYQLALSEISMLLECARMLRDYAIDIAEERTPTGLPDHLIDPRSTDAIDLVLGTLKRCGFTKAVQRAVVLAIASELDAGGIDQPNSAESNGNISKSEPSSICTGGDLQTPISDPESDTAQPKPATEGTNGNDLQVPTAADFKRFRQKEDLKRSLIGPGEILTEESFIQTALEAVESILEACPYVSQPGDGGPCLEEEATRAYAGMKAALRAGVRAVEPVDIDASDLGRAAQ